MRFKVPHHIEYKTKIVGPANFTQLAYLIVAGMIILALYVFMGVSLPFIFLSIVVAAGGVALAFLQIKGQPLPSYIKKFFFFSLSSKKYIWKKKDPPMKASLPKKDKRKAEKREKEKKDLQLKEGGKIGKVIDRLRSS